MVSTVSFYLYFVSCPNTFLYCLVSDDNWDNYYCNGDWYKESGAFCHHILYGRSYNQIKGMERRLWRFMYMYFLLT